MEDSEWLSFKSEVDAEIEQFGLTVYFSGEGLGKTDEGSEQSYAWIVEARPLFEATREEAAFNPYRGTNNFEDAMRRLAWTYPQESIGVIYGSTFMVYADGRDRRRVVEFA